VSNVNYEFYVKCSDQFL